MTYSYYSDKPYHALDLSWWTVFPIKENEVATYGRFKLRWEIIPRRTNGRQIYSWQSSKEVVTYISIDDKSYSEYNYQWKGSNQALSNELNDEIKKVRSVHQRARAREKAKENKATKEQLAKQQGITVEELNAQNRKKRRAKQEEKKAHSTIRQMDDIIKAGPVIKALYDDLGAFLSHLNNGGQVNITHARTKLRYFRYVQQILTQWKKIPKTKQR